MEEENERKRERKEKGDNKRWKKWGIKNGQGEWKCKDAEREVEEWKERKKQNKEEKSDGETGKMSEKELTFCQMYPSPYSGEKNCDRRYAQCQTQCAVPRDVIVILSLPHRLRSGPLLLLSSADVVAGSGRAMGLRAPAALSSMIHVFKVMHIPGRCRALGNGH
ncbi:hypothetical protein UY3_04220 [Chelonia mydas]|uniref:Uncharacterized protein n=1 Tax=Chelonia mydas TaxID=8469 RepID=M7BKZ7_CHEMY|nr:hypothetical protein UY3_04220 [Chelonia mydas]